MSYTIAPPSRRISPRLYTALNVIRSFAALYVVLHHVVQHAEIGGPVSYVFRFGQEAVILFFLLSGFVIYANDAHRTLGSVGQYFLRRFLRIYPTFLAALLITAAVVAFNGTIARDWDTWGFIGNLFSLQDTSDLKPGVLVDPFLGNNPLWSLSYEVAFYLLFPLILLVKVRLPRATLHVVGAFSVAAYVTYLVAPNHVSLVAGYLFVWYAGAVAADLYGRGDLRFRTYLPVITWSAALTVVSLLGVVTDSYHGVGIFPLLQTRHFAFTVLCTILIVTPLARVFAKWTLPFTRPAAYIASISYGLYVFHYPLLVQWDASQSILGLAAAAILLVVFAILGDRQLDNLIKRIRRGSRVTR